MKRVQITVSILTLMLTLNAESRHGTVYREPLHVNLHRNTHVEPKVLKGAIRYADRILAQAGVRVLWWDCGVSGPTAENCAAPGPTTLLIRFYDSTEQEAPVKPKSNSLAFSLPRPAPEHGFFAGIFWNRVRQLAGDHQMDAGVVLGCVLAHEIGHLLLGQAEHAQTGIMAVPWGDEMLVYLSQGSLLFTADQIRKIRANLELRLQEQREQVSQTAPPIADP